MKKHKVKNSILSLFSYAAVTLTVLVTLIPLGWIVSTSLKPSVEIFSNPPRWIPINPTISNYTDVLLNSHIPRAFLNSLLIGLLSTFLALLLGGAAGYAFAKYKFRGSKFFSLFMLISQMLPLTVLMIPLFYMQNNIGLIDTKLGLAIAHLVISMPLVTWMCKGYFSGIPKEIEEAATIDGCSTVQLFAKVILPIIRPALAAAGIYAFISSWNEFPLATVLTRSMDSRTVPIALNEFSSFFRVNWGNTMAASAIITIPVIISFMLVQKQFVSGLTSGAVKD